MKTTLGVGVSVNVDEIEVIEASLYEEGLYVIVNN